MAMSTSKQHKLIMAASEAVKIAKCDHAFVMTPTQPRNKRMIRVFCPRCEGAFTESASEK